MKTQDHLIFLLTALAITCILVACSGSGVNLTGTSSQSTATIPQDQTPITLPTISGLKGIVLDAQTGKQVVGVYIVFQSSDGAVWKDTFSDPNGSFRIDLPQGSYRVIASLQDYQKYSSDKPIELTEPGYQTISISLGPKGVATATAPAQVKSLGKCVNGVCWYFGDENLSCEAVCSTHGGYNEATKDFAGSGGSPYYCYSVVVIVEIPTFYDSNVATETNHGGLGCYVKQQNINDPYTSYWDKDPTTAQAISNTPGIHRICACQK